MLIFHLDILRGMEMKYKLFGNTSLKVSEIALGTMTFGKEWGWGGNKDEVKELFDLYVENGGNFIDTANVYTNGTSEELCGEFIQNNRHHFVLSTKYSLNTDPANINAGGNSRKAIISSVEASLKRLKTDYIDIFWMHAWDGFSKPEEVLRALDDLVKQGKVLYLGVSDTPAWWVSRANAIAELTQMSAFQAIQVEYSLIERTVERELFPMANEHGLSITTWGPLAGGVLSGKYNQENDQPKRHTEGPWAEKYLSQHNLNIAQTLIDLGDKLNVSASQLALAWVLAKRKDYPGIIPLWGARNAAQLGQNLKALDISLNDEIMQQLEDLTKVDLGFPMNFLNLVQEVIHGEKGNLIER
jgi:aryl-alcohol dehydrogenase-like predicted oxidoreductase